MSIYTGDKLIASSGTNDYNNLKNKPSINGKELDGEVTLDELGIQESIDYSTLLNSIYPIGSIYLGIQSICPMQTLMVGSEWELVSADRTLQGASDTHLAGSTIEAGLPNITGSAYNNEGNAITSYYPNKTGAFYGLSDLGKVGWYSTPGLSNSDSIGFSLGFDASRSSSVYGNSTTVQPSAYVINIWQRIA